MTPADDRLMTVKQVAELLDVSTQWVYMHANGLRPVLPSIKLGWAVRFRREAVERFIKDNERV